MKRGSVLINSSREELTDNNAIANALDGGKLSGAAVDLDFHSETKIPKAITTLHTAWNSPDSFEVGNEMFVQNLVAWRNGKPKNQLT
jgi:phosphoglycerate dehydrogenase-like enzyme